MTQRPMRTKEFSEVGAIVRPGGPNYLRIGKNFRLTKAVGIAILLPIRSVSRSPPRSTG